MTEEKPEQPKPLHRFSDFAVVHQKLEGERIQNIAEILNKELIFTAFSICKSKVKGCDKYITIQFKESENSPYRVAFTASTVLIDQFVEYAEQLPFVATIKKVNRYMTLT